MNTIRPAIKKFVIVDQAAAEDRAKNRHFRDCKKLGVPLISVTKSGKGARVEADLVTMSRAIVECDSERVHQLMSQYQSGKGYTSGSEHLQSALLSEQSALELAEKLYDVLTVA
ncbi:hypothetical protein [uncultured Microbulbifer sp.]|uniref:hypothetical protein n=1 Tax=uncultured Microbulbifer sp. TaxID=348147 RepID=UPI002639C81A|nr:hypothetical protein [uncultured Microbulbifer sp.]